MTIDEMLSYECRNFASSYTALRRLRYKNLPTAKYVETIDATRIPTRIKRYVPCYVEVKAWKLPLAVIFNNRNTILFDMKGEKLIIGDSCIITPEGDLLFKGIKERSNLTAYIDNVIWDGLFQSKYPQFCKIVFKDLIPTLATNNVKIITMRKTDHYKTQGDKPVKLGKEMDKILQSVALQHIENIQFM